MDEQGFVQRILIYEDTVTFLEGDKAFNERVQPDVGVVHHFSGSVVLDHEERVRILHIQIGAYIIPERRAIAEITEGIPSWSRIEGGRISLSRHVVSTFAVGHRDV